MNVQTACLSTSERDGLRLTICEIKEIWIDMERAREQAHEEDAPIIEGMLDFLSLLPGERGQQEKAVVRIGASAPSRFVTEVIETCRRAGMSPANFVKVIGRDPGEARDVLWRYASGGRQMSHKLLRRLILSAQKNHWIDAPVPEGMPPRPHEIIFKYGWGKVPEADLRASLTAWEPYSGPKTFSVWRDRMRAMRACVLLARNRVSSRCKTRQEFSLERVRQIALVDLDFEPALFVATLQSNPRSLGQKIRRAREDLRKNLGGRYANGEDPGDLFWHCLDMTQFRRTLSKF